ncbi:hypothetical protein TIFTF001_048245, partial [Ficus carica]
GHPFNTTPPDFPTSAPSSTLPHNVAAGSFLASAILSLPHATTASCTSSLFACLLSLDPIPPTHIYNASAHAVGVEEVTPPFHDTTARSTTLIEASIDDTV